METPSSTKRVTRSQTLSASNNNNLPISRKIEESEKGITNSKQRNANVQQDRSALIDITNDSPIVGVAKDSLQTPLSSIAKQRNNRVKKTPGSGEALLRGQVKTLLQKVEEEAVLSKLSLENRPILHLSPAGLLAPTPANTPQIQSTEMAPSPYVEDQLMIPQVLSNVNEEKQERSLESQKSIITRSLLMDFSEKSEIYDSSECSSDLTYQGEGKEEEANERKEKKIPYDDDEASIWSIQVNASSTQDEDEEETVDGEEDYYYYEEEEDEVERDEYEYDNDNDVLVDELCECISKISVNEIPKFEGKHTRFVYNSEDEIVEEESGENEEGVSPNVMRLKGLPTPKGKHLRFVEEETNA